MWRMEKSMRITLKRFYGEYIVTVNGTPYTFTSSIAALTFAFAVHYQHGKEASV